MLFWKLMKLTNQRIRVLVKSFWFLKFILKRRPEWFQERRTKPVRVGTKMEEGIVMISPRWKGQRNTSSITASRKGQTFTDTLILFH